MGYVIPMASFTVPCSGSDNSDADEVWTRDGHLGVNYGCPPLCVMDEQVEKPDSEETWIALVQRGGCSFAEKVREAQRWGAKGVVVGGSDPQLTNAPDVLLGMYSPGEGSCRGLDCRALMR